MKITILGCGASGGVPIFAGQWGACRPDNPRNRRRRCAALVENANTRVLIDTPPELRQQLLDSDTTWLSATLFTHAHADHLHGIDDLRGINRSMRAPIPIYGTPETLENIRTRFGYVLAAPDGTGNFWRPSLEPQELLHGTTRSIGTLEVTAFEQDHGFSITTGYRIGPVSYSTDAKRLPDQALSVVSGSTIWIVDCQHFVEQPTHSHFEQTLEWIERANVERAILTHMGQGMDYEETMSKCPPGVEPAYDGMVISL